MLERLTRWSARVPRIRRLRSRAVEPLLRTHSASFDAPELHAWEARGWLDIGEAERLNAVAEPIGVPKMVFVVTLGRWRVGRAALSSMWHRLGIPGAWVGGLVVEPVVRGCGVGRRLLDDIVLTAGHLPGVTELWANVREDNQVSLRLFRSAGFGVVPHPDWERRIAEHYARYSRWPGRRDVILRRSVGTGRKT
ncbi:MAG: GNAT family N-acetyltransferase [Deltaproteobacteria bacterium]|nr:GNAT family N-acetyltransferase [Deltaproteobacteria bacterium]